MSVDDRYGCKLSYQQFECLRSRGDVPFSSDSKAFAEPIAANYPQQVRLSHAFARLYPAEQFIHGLTTNGTFLTIRSGHITVVAQDVVDAAAYQSTILILKSNGTVFISSNSGLKAVSVEKAAKLYVGKSHQLIVTSEGVVYGCGSNRKGQLGLGLAEETNQWVRIQSVGSVEQAACGFSHSLLLTKKGVVYSAGSSQSEAKHANGFREVAIGPRVKAITASRFSAALSQEGGLYLWGAGVFGTFSYPTRVALQSSFDRVVLGQTFGFALGTQGVFCWGNNSSGQLGLANFSNQPTPLKNQSFQKYEVTDIFAGATCAIAIGLPKDYIPAVKTVPRRKPAQVGPALQTMEEVLRQQNQQLLLELDLQGEQKKMLGQLNKQLAQKVNQLQQGPQGVNLMTVKLRSQQNQIGELREQINRLTRILREQRAEVSKLSKLCTSLEEDKKELLARLERRERDIIQLQEEIKQLQSLRNCESADLRQSLQEADSRCKGLAQVLSAKGREQMRRSELQEDTERLLEQMRAEQDKLHETVSFVQAEKVYLQSKLVEYECRLNTEGAWANDCEKARVEAENISKHCQQRVRLLEQRNLQLKVQLSQSRSELFAQGGAGLSRLEDYSTLLGLNSELVESVRQLRQRLRGREPTQVQQPALLSQLTKRTNEVQEALEEARKRTELTKRIMCEDL